MDVFTYKTYSQFSHERRVKIDSAREQLNAFITDNNINDPGFLAPFSHHASFKSIFYSDISKGSFGLFLVQPACPAINEEYPDFDMLMAYAYEGGKLSALRNLKQSTGVDISGLVETLLSTPPQAFILRSGLRPGDHTNQMYLGLVSALIKQHPKVIEQTLAPNNGVYTHPQKMMHLALYCLADAAGITDLSTINVPSPYPSRELRSLIGVSTTRNPEQYQFLLHRHGNADQEDLSLTATFLFAAFAQAVKATDTKKLINDLMPRATAWLMNSGCHLSNMADSTEQLIASALLSTPGHFRAGGFSQRNMYGMESGYTPKRIHKQIIDGPLGLLLSSQSTDDQVYYALAYTQDLMPGFTINQLLQDRGLSHSNCLTLLRAVGGYLPALEDHILQGNLKPEVCFKLVNHIYECNNYHKYSPQALINLMQTYLERLPKIDSQGKRMSSNFLELSGNMQLRAKEAFSLARANCEGFRQALCDYLEAETGITAAHLDMVGLGHHDVPKTMRRMHRSERAKLLEGCLGL